MVGARRIEQDAHQVSYLAAGDLREDVPGSG